MEGKRMTSCVYCDRQTHPAGPVGLRPSKDHIVPKPFGDYGPHNIATACVDCNRMKGSRTPAQMREAANAAIRMAERWRALADRVDSLVADRGILPPWTVDTVLSEGE